MEDYEWVPNLKWFEVKCWKFWLSFEGDRELGMRVLRVFMLEKKRFVMIDAWMNENCHIKLFHAFCIDTY